MLEELAEELPKPESTKRCLTFDSPNQQNKEKDIHFEHQENDLGVTCLQDLKIDSFGQDSKILQVGHTIVIVIWT